MLHKGERGRLGWGHKGCGGSWFLQQGTGLGVGATLGVGRWPRLPTPPRRLGNTRDAQGEAAGWKPPAPVRHPGRIAHSPGRVTQKSVQTRRTSGTPEDSHVWRVPGSGQQRKAAGAPPHLRSGQEARASREERAPSPGHPSLNSASGLRPHSSPGPRAGALVPLPRASPEPRKRAARGTMGSAVQPHHALGSRGRPKREPGLQVPPRPKAGASQLASRPARRLSARGRPSPAVAADVAAPEPPPPPPPPPPRWGAFRFLFFGIVGRPVPPTLGSSARISRWSCTVYSCVCAAGG